MDQQDDYIKDIVEIRSMMERTTKFLSLSGWAGIMAGVYGLAGAGLAYKVFGFNPDDILYVSFSEAGHSLMNIILLALAILVLAIGTAVYLSRNKAIKRGERVWNPTSRRMLINMAVPLVVGGLFILILISKGLIGLIAPTTLIFYGLSLYIAGKYTFEDIKVLGLLQITLGLISAYYIGYSIILWAVGFGFGHIVYGIYVHYKYEK